MCILYDNNDFQEYKKGQLNSKIFHTKTCSIYKVLVFSKIRRYIKCSQKRLNYSHISSSKRKNTLYLIKCIWRIKKISFILILVNHKIITRIKKYVFAKVAFDELVNF